MTTAAKFVPIVAFSGFMEKERVKENWPSDSRRFIMADYMPEYYPKETLTTISAN